MDKLKEHIQSVINTYKSGDLPKAEQVSKKLIAANPRSDVERSSADTRPFAPGHRTPRLCPERSVERVQTGSLQHV